MPNDLELRASTVEDALNGAATAFELAESLRERTQEVVRLQSNLRAVDAEKKTLTAQIEILRNAVVAGQDIVRRMQSEQATLAGQKHKLRVKLEAVSAKWWFKLFASRNMKAWLDRAL